jgi:hypothetical protein
VRVENNYKMTYQEHLAERENLKKDFSLIDYFAVNIYALEMSLSNSFAWGWLRLNDTVKEKYRNKAKEVFEVYQNGEDELFKKRTEVKFRDFVEREIDMKLSA